MRFPSEHNETERKSFVDAALHEAARYESETPAPPGLAARALAQHARSGSRCGQTRPAPALLASACGLVLLIGSGMWLHQSHHLPKRQPDTGSAIAFRPATKAASLAERWPHIEIVHTLLPPIDLPTFLVSAGRTPNRHRIAHYRVRYRHRPSLARHNRLPIQANRSAGVWTTETLSCEVVTQTLTPVWVAQTDPVTRTIVLTPALYQLSLQPDGDADPTTASVGAALIPVRFEQENTNP